MEILLALAIGFGGGWWIAPTKAIECADKALVIASCPEPTALEDKTFGGHILKLQEVGGQYRECRAACVGSMR